MSNSLTFSNFSRQSPKGILVIYFNLIYKVVKVTWILLFFALRDYNKLSNLGLNYFYISIGFILLFLSVRAYLIYKNFQFKVDNEHFVLKQGILKKTNTAIPFHRIQNINFKQNIVQQIMGVFEISIETAGSSDTEISIKALSLEKAKNLKEILSKNAELNNDLIYNVEEKPLVKIGVKELVKVSLTENHLQNLFLFLAIVFGFFQQVQDIVDYFGQSEAFDGFIKNSANSFSKGFFIFFILLVILIITAFITSFAKIFLKHFNLIAYLKEDAFEINQGLFIKKSIVLKKQKVQNITISTNPLKRLIGISFITFKQAVSGEISKKKDKLIRIVGCNKDQVETVKESLFDISEVENKEKKNPENYYKQRIFIFSFLTLIILYAALYMFFPLLEIFFSTLLVFPIVVFLIFKKVKKRFYQISEDMLLVGRGLIETHLTYLELFKVQNIQMKQTIFQKRSNVADLILQTASGKIEIPCLNYQEAVKNYNHILYKVETSQNSWM